MFPEIRLSDTLLIPTYFVYISVLYCFLLVYVLRRARAHGENASTALDLGLILMVGGFLGGRLLHVFYELPQYYAEDWTRVFKIWEGGFVFYGGFLTALAGCLLLVWRRRLSFNRWADFYAPVIALGYGLGRVSCFLAGCCYGRACDLPWGVTFPWDAERILRHPTQLYAVIWELSVFGLLIFLERRKIPSRIPGLVFWSWILLHSLGRLMMESFRDDFRGHLLFGLSLSTVISLLLLALAAAKLFTIYKRK